MKIILTEGCVCDSLTIDDKEARDYSNKELVSIIKKVLDYEKSKFNLIKLLGMIVEIFGEYSTDESIIGTDKYGTLTQQDGTDIVTVGGRDANGFTEEEIRDIILTIIDSMDESADVLWALRGLIQNLGEYKFCYHCDECGDNVAEYKLKI